MEETTQQREYDMDERSQFGEMKCLIKLQVSMPVYLSAQDVCEAAMG